MLFGSFQSDYDFLLNKFRKPVFPEQNAMENEAIRSHLEQITDFNASPELEKAAAFDFICKNMQIDVNPHDWFVSFGCWQRNRRPAKGMIAKRACYATEHFAPQDIQKKIREGFAAGALSMWMDLDHSIPDWDRLMAGGFPGIVRFVEQNRETHRQNGTLDERKEQYFAGILNTYRSILETLARFRKFGLERYPESDRVKRVCESISQLEQGAPQNFLDALELIFFYFMFSEHVDHFQVRSLGNLDVMLYPFYQRDLENGTFTEAEMRELLAYFLMQWGSIDNYWGQPFYMAGTNADGSSRVNPLSYIILQEFDKLNIPTPKIQIKVNRNTPEDFLKLALDMIRRGHSSLVFINEKAIEKSMLVLGRTPEEAADPDITGCYEWGAKANENITQSIHCNLVKMVELALNDGFDPETQVQFGPHTGNAEDLRSFSDFYEAFLKQTSECIETIIRGNDLVYEPYLRFSSPAQVLSGTMEYSLRKGEDAFSTGSKYNSSMLLTVGFATAIDALMAVKDLVFDRKTVSLPELRDVCRANWAGHEKLRMLALHNPNKFGNHVETVDFYARMLAGYLSNYVNMRPNCRGGHYMISSHPARQFISLGEKTGATPDGRFAGEETSKNISPTMGMDRHGVTAVIESVTAIDPSLFPGNFTLDVMMHPTSVAGAEGLDALYSLVRVYFAKGGNAIQVNIFDAAELKKAQQEPERYGSLQVRVCGWNVRFLDLPKVEQDKYITRAENIIE